MSAFNDYDRDALIESIRDYAKNNSEMQLVDVIDKVMEAVTYGIKHIIWDRKEK